MLFEGFRSVVVLNSCEKGATLHFLNCLTLALSIDELLRGQLYGLAIDHFRDDADLDNRLFALGLDERRRGLTDWCCFLL